MDSELISIVMATYNGEKYIKEQIDSILNQSYSNWELIISDDGSKDSTLEIVKKYCEKDKRIKLVINNNHHGFAQNFINGIKYINGEFVAFADQDDVWPDNHLLSLISNIGKNDFICGNASLVDENCRYLGYTMKDVLGINKLPDNKNALLNLLFYSNIFQGAACLFTKKIAVKISELPENVYFHDHWIALFSCVNNGCRFIDEEVLLYRQHGNNVTSNTKKKLFHKIFPDKETLENEKKLFKYNLLMLENLINYDEFTQYNKEIKDAINYFRNILSGKSIKNLFIFFKNYKKMYYCKKSNICIFLFRFIKLLSM